MNQIWIVVLVLAALYFITRMKARRKPVEPEPQLKALRIQGFQLTAYINPRMGSGCLFDHGMQFGRGFRRKEGPALPHDGDCGCEVVPFSFSSSEVFNGALRNLTSVRSTLPGLTPEGARLLMDKLKALEGQLLPAGEEGYVAAVDPGAFPNELRAALQEFLAERYRFLKNRANETKPTDLPDHPTSDPAEKEKST
jgi:hypothetical protein